MTWSCHSRWEPLHFRAPQNNKTVIRRFLHEPFLYVSLYIIIIIRFLYEPFPVESCLHEQLHDHLNAEVVGGTVRSKQACRHTPPASRAFGLCRSSDVRLAGRARRTARIYHLLTYLPTHPLTYPQDALDFLTWTYFYRRLLQNPAYYAAGAASGSDVGAFASELIETTLDDLACAGCVEISGAPTTTAATATPATTTAVVAVSGDDGLAVSPTTLGRIASYYYLSHQTVALFSAELADVDEAVTELPTLLRVLCAASEYDELPVRHNEEHVNEQAPPVVGVGSACVWPCSGRVRSRPCVNAQMAGADMLLMMMMMMMMCRL